MSLSPEQAARQLEKRKRELSVPLTPDIYAWYRQMRGERIVYEERRGVWVVLRYADVEHVVRDVDSFSSHRTLKADGSVDEINGAGMLGADPPRHRHLRSPVVQAFTQKRIAQLEPRIREIAVQLLDAMGKSGTGELVNDFAYPFPVLVIGELLGVPTQDARRFQHLAVDVLGSNYERRMQAFGALATYFDQLIKERAREPRQDLISELLNAEVDGERIKHAELIGACLLLLIAGHETTASLIGNAMWCFDEHPQAWQAVLADPSLLPGAIEEVLRYRSVVHWMTRVVKRDMRYLDQDLKSGDLMIASYAAANIDPERFVEPDRFDIRRTPNRHIGFGFGIHLCLGATLARLEAQIGLGELLARFPRIARDRSQPLEVRANPFIYALKAFPVHLQG